MIQKQQVLSILYQVPVILYHFLTYAASELVTTTILSNSDIEIESCPLAHLSLFQTNQIMPLSC